MNTKIWLEELSFGSNFGHLRAIGSNRVWCYFILHVFKIKKFESISLNGSRDIAKSLKISFGSNFKILAVSIPSIHLSNKKTALDYPYPFLSFSVHNFCARTDGRTDRHFLKNFLFSSCSRIYIHVYTYLDYFSNFTPILTKISIPFFPV